MIKKFTTLDERYIGTNYLEELILGYNLNLSRN